MIDKVPKYPDELIRKHKCTAVCNQFAIGHLVPSINREYLIKNHHKLFNYDPKENELLQTDTKLGVIKEETKGIIEGLINSLNCAVCECCGKKNVL